MKKGLILLVFVLLIFGCVPYNEMIKRIPLVEFNSFSYHRAGNITSASITATGARIENGVITIDDIHIIEDYGPFVNFDIQLHGYRRKIGDSK